eukprot:gene10789-16937_t
MAWVEDAPPQPSGLVPEGGRMHAMMAVISLSAKLAVMSLHARMAVRIMHATLAMSNIGRPGSKAAAAAQW